jgi:hypothetical protein
MGGIHVVAPVFAQGGTMAMENDIESTAARRYVNAAIA